MSIDTNIWVIIKHYRYEIVNDKFLVFEYFSVLSISPLVLIQLATGNIISGNDEAKRDCVIALIRSELTKTFTNKYRAAQYCYESSGRYHEYLMLDYNMELIMNPDSLCCDITNDI